MEDRKTKEIVKDKIIIKCMKNICNYYNKNYDIILVYLKIQ